MGGGGGEIGESYLLNPPYAIHTLLWMVGFGEGGVTWLRSVEENLDRLSLSARCLTPTPTTEKCHPPKKRAGHHRSHSDGAEPSNANWSSIFRINDHRKSPISQTRKPSLLPSAA